MWRRLAAVVRWREWINSVRVWVPALAIAATLPPGALLIHDVQDRQAAALHEARENLEATTLESSRALGAWVVNHTEVIRAMAQRPSVVAMRCDSLLADYMAINRTVTAATILDLDGAIRCHLGATLPAQSPEQIRQMPWFKSALAADGVGPPVFSSRMKRWNLPISAKIHDPAGRPVGLLVVAHLQSRLQEDVFGSVEIGLTVGVVNAEGVFIMRSRDSERFTGKRATPESLRLVSGTDGHGEFEYAGIDGTRPRMLVLTRQVPNTQLTVYGAMPQATIVAQQRQVLTFYMFVMTATALLALTIASVMSRAIARPIAMVARASREAMRSRVSLPETTGGPIEIRELLANFKALVEARDDLENTLRESEARYRAIIDASPVPCALTFDLDTVSFVNEAFERELGYRLSDFSTIEDLRNLFYRDVTYREKIAREWGAALRKTVETGRPHDPIHLTVRTKDGRDLFMLGSVTVLARFQRPAYLVSLYDVTDIERARARERLHSQVWRQSSEYMMVVNTSGQIVDINPAAALALQRPIEEVIGQSGNAFFAEQPSSEERNRVRRESDRTGIAFASRIMRRRDGTTFRISATVISLRNDNGEIGARLVISRDQTAEDAKRVLLERYSSLVDSARDPILTVDRRGLIQLCNPAACNVFGYTAPEMLGRDLRLLIPELSSVQPTDLLATFFQGSEAGTGITRFQTLAGRGKDGRMLRLQLSLSKAGDGEDAIVTVMIRDVTEMERLQDQLHQADKLAAIGRLTGGIAHDVNNLLAVVMANAELIETMADADSRVGLLSRRITDSARSGGELIARLLAFSRRSRIEARQIDACGVLREVAETVRPTLGRKIAVIVQTPRESLFINADPSMLESCLVNLCVNARDAMPAGGTLSLSVRAESAAESTGDAVVILVEDDGIGMPDEVRRRIFEPFFSTKPRGHGTGLGLSMVYGFVQQSGGTIDVASQPGEGTRITLRLPRIQPAETPTSRNDTPVPLGAQTVLLVEDNPMLRMTLREQIQALGCQVIEAASMEEAKARIREMPDIGGVLSDFDLGSAGTGLELAEWLQASGYGIPGAIISGYPNTPADRITQVGWPLLQKPVSLAAVSRVLKAFQAPTADRGPERPQLH